MLFYKETADIVSDNAPHRRWIDEGEENKYV